MEKEGCQGPFISRRDLLKGAVLISGGIFLGSEMTGIGASDVLKALKISYEYGPDVALAVCKYPDRTLDAYRLWKEPDKKYQRMPFFKENLLYKEDASNAILGFGDSNLEGAEGDGSKWRLSPVHQFRKMAQEEFGFEDWNDFNCARAGSTIATVIDEQVLSQKAQDGFDYSPRCDIWVNVGGNDMSTLVKNEMEVSELNKLSNDPFNNMSLLLKYTERIEDNIKDFKSNFLRLLNSIYEPNYSKIRQFVIMSAPDFGKVDSIVTQEIEGQAHYIAIQSNAIRRLIKNITTRMNNVMFEAVDDFQKDTKARIIGLDTTDPQISVFSSNQHFSEEACYLIAKEAIGRTKIVYQ